MLYQRQGSFSLSREGKIIGDGTHNIGISFLSGEAKFGCLMAS